MKLATKQNKTNKKHSSRKKKEKEKKKKRKRKKVIFIESRIIEVGRFVQFYHSYVVTDSTVYIQ